MLLQVCSSGLQINFNFVKQKVLHRKRSRLSSLSIAYLSSYVGAFFNKSSVSLTNYIIYKDHNELLFCNYIHILPLAIKSIFFIPSPTKLRRDIVTLPSFLPSFCNILVNTLESTSFNGF